jgi:ABC-type phosphate/phosphonate transport system substrate-binding protein
MQRRLTIQFILCLAPFIVLLAACANNSEDKVIPYHPAFSADTLVKNQLILGFPNFSYAETAEPLIKYLNNHLPGVEVKVKCSVSWEEHIENLNRGKFDLLLVNGLVAAKATGKGYSIVGKVAGDDAYTSVVFTRKELAIKKAIDLKNKRVALVASRLIPGTMIPLYHLYKDGLDVNHDIHLVKVSSFEATIISAYRGESDAGICLKRNWNVYIKEHPEVLSKVAITWEVPALVHTALVVKSTIDSGTVSRLLNALLTIHTSSEGRGALKKLDIIGFEKADNDTYKPLLEFEKKIDSVIVVI